MLCGTFEQEHLTPQEKCLQRSVFRDAPPGSSSNLDHDAVRNELLIVQELLSRLRIRLLLTQILCRTAVGALLLFLCFCLGLLSGCRLTQHPNSCPLSTINLVCYGICCNMIAPLSFEHIHALERTRREPSITPNPYLEHFQSSSSVSRPRQLADPTSASTSKILDLAQWQ
jgi:hypothetical protein